MVRNSVILKTLFVSFSVILFVTMDIMTTSAENDSPATVADSIGTDFTYQGRLKVDGRPANGKYNFRFNLWAEQSKTTLLGTYPKISTVELEVLDGYFTVILDFGVGIFDGDERWLEIEVNGTLLSPLQPVTPSPYAIYSQTTSWSGITEVPFAGSGSENTLARSDHNHWGQSWSGPGTGKGLYIYGGYFGLEARGSLYGVIGVTSGTAYAGVKGEASSNSGSSIGVWGHSYGDTGKGVLGVGESNSGTNYGVYGQSWSTGGTAVYGEALANSGNTFGVVGVSESSSGLGVKGTVTSETGTTYGVVGYSASPDGYAGYFRNTSSGVGLYVQSDSGTGNIIEAASNFGDIEFRVERDGDLFIDGDFNNSGADYAEMMLASSGLEPGEVLVIGPEGKLERSNQPYETSVVGVYSTNPGFIAGALDDGTDLSEQVPLAVMGVVPVKVSAENGPIQLGDLLTSSSTSGHAMRAGDNPEPGTIIGKALEKWNVGSGIIKMLVMLR
jgi:hypothetical protein